MRQTIIVGPGQLDADLNEFLAQLSELVRW
jgi:hypothetical protein